MKKFTKKVAFLVAGMMLFTAAPCVAFATAETTPETTQASSKKEATGLKGFFNKIFGKNEEETEEYIVTINGMPLNIGENAQKVKDPLVITEVDYGTIKGDIFTIDCTGIEGLMINNASASVESTNVKIDKVTVKDNVITISILPPASELAMQAPTIVTLTEITATVKGTATEGSYAGKLTISSPPANANEEATVLYEKELPNFITLSKKTAEAGTINTESTPFELTPGKMNQVGGAITLTESAPTTFKAGNILIDLPKADGLSFTKIPVVAVTKGDMVVGATSIEEMKNDTTGAIISQKITIPITTTSTTSSAITIKDFTADVASTTPVGNYPAVITLPEHPTTITIADFAVVATPEESNELAKNKVTFVLGEKTYTVNGKKEEMDTVAYSENGRTMIPLKYLSTALGIPANAIKWDNATKTATITVGEKIIQAKAGSKDLVVDKEVRPMSTAAVIKDGRLIVPVAEIARALDIPTGFDAATKTVTFN